MSSDDRPADFTPSAPRAGGAPTGAASDADLPAGAVPAGDVPAAPDAAAVPDAASVPDAATLEQIATPARRRRAPRISAFITTGVLVGAVVGWVLALLGTGTTGEGRTGAILLTTAGLGVLGAIVGAGLAALADRRSAPRVARRSGRGRRTAR